MVLADAGAAKMEISARGVSNKGRRAKEDVWRSILHSPYRMPILFKSFSNRG